MCWIFLTYSTFMTVSFIKNLHIVNFKKRDITVVLFSRLLSVVSEFSIVDVFKLCSLRVCCGLLNSGDCKHLVVCCAMCY